MSSGSRRTMFRMTLLIMPIVTANTAWAQDHEENTAAMAEQQRGELRDALTEPDCEGDEFQRDTIVVCGEAGAAAETREHMSVLPLPVASDRVILPGLNDPPCWVVPTGGVCIRGGWKPPPVVLIDLDQFPDALTAEEAAGVFAVAEDEE